MPADLILRGAREHNLTGVDLDLPLGAWTAVVGPSGSGKTSLVFDTVVREGRRRVLGALSARARHLLGKLGRADVGRLDGLPATVAVGERAASDSPRSTVGTLTGALDLLRLLYARCADDPGGVALTRSHFSFNRPEGACEVCGGLGLADRVTPELLLDDPARTIRGGALKPTLKNGYTVYSQVTVDVMDSICRAHGFDVDTPWRDLTDEQRHVIMYGSTKLKVPFGKHGLESRMKWEGITARPREEGYYRGLVPVIEETLKRNRNPNVLRFVETVPCPTCDGTRLARPGREASLGGRRLPQLSALPTRALSSALDDLPPSEVLSAVRASLDPRLARMQRLGLGHLALDRTSATLSGGEAQRLRLAGQLTAGLSRQLVALDEPTLGLHPSEQAGMASVLEELRDLGNTLLVVEHDPDLVRHADHLVRLGPGAGNHGGRVVQAGPLADDDTPGGPLGAAPPRKATPRTARGHLALRGATLHTLRQADLVVGLGTLHVVMGPSGAGKSSLVFGTLLPALQGLPGGAFDSLEGATEGGVHALDARPLGRTSRSTPATWSGLFDLVRKRFAAEPLARERSWGAGHFSYNTGGGRCPACEGLGVTRVGLHLLEDLELACGACGGGRYAADALDVRWRGLTIAEVLALTVAQAREAFAGDDRLHALVSAMDTLGLGHLPLGQASHRLSRGEGQRVRLATLLGTRDARPSFVLLDEPDRGLHPGDVALLLAAIDALVDQGHTVVAISHHRHVWAAADELTEVVDGVARPVDGLGARPPAPAPRAHAAATPPSAVRLRGVRTHNLAGLDVDLPHDRLVGVCGVSGSGKSSLVFDTLAAEAWRRFGEGLPFEVRRAMQRLPRPELSHATGLSPTLALRSGQARAGARSTVATQSDVGPLLRLLWSRAGVVDGAPCGLTAGHFSTEQALGACLDCEGRGVLPRADADLLVTHPDRPLAEGALGGTRPGRFFGEAGGQYLATLRAALEDDVDLTRPWRELPPAVQDVALHGAGERVFDVRWTYTRGKRSGEHHFEGPWEGLLRLVEREALRRAGSAKAAEWRAPLVEAPCSTCRGGGLRPEVASVTVGGLTLADVLALPVDEVVPRLESARAGSAAASVIDALLPELRERLDDLDALGLGHLALGRRSRTLSEGELQRTRLAGVLRSGLTGMTFALDEPASGLHPRDVTRLLARLRRLVDAGNTVVIVSHRPELLGEVDELLELGPGPGADGGRLLAQGPPDQVLAGDGPTAAALREHASRRTRCAGPDAGRLRVVGARAHTLRDVTFELPSSGFVCMTGVSGSGKSSLLFDVLAASARASAPVACDAIESVDGATGWPLSRYAALHTSRDAPRGQVVLTSLGLMPALQALFHGVCDDPSLKRSAFSFLSPAGRCATCRGSGREVVAMDALADLSLPCPECGGRRYRPSVLAVRWEGLDAAAFLDEPAVTLLPLLPAGGLRDAVTALLDVGLGHLSLGRRSHGLSHGEGQRVALASGLLGRDGPTLRLLDEPATGLHEADLARLLDVFDRLIAGGDLIVAAEHRASLIAAADLELELGPGGGAAGGTLVATRP